MPDLRVLTNIPNPYNGALYGSLSNIGCRTEVFYKSDPAAEGRSWELPMQACERVVSRRADVRALLRHPAEHTIISGGYHRERDLLRITCAAASNTNLLFWGERLRNDLISARARFVLRAIFRPFNCVLAVGSRARTSYQQITLGRIPVHTFPYGLPAPSRRPDRHDSPILGFAGSLIARKGVADLLRAVATTKRKPNVEIVGTGPLRDTLGRLAQQLGLSVTWFGEVTKERLDAVRCRWWAQVVPSHYDGWAMVVPEALVAGVPVIATNEVGAAHDLILPGITGELTNSPRELVEAMNRVLDSAYQQHLSAAASVLGGELVAERGAEWLSALLTERPSTPESFLDHALHCAQKAGLPSRQGPE